MTSLRLLPALLLLPLAACGVPEAPQAAPGAVERLTAELDQKEEAERRAISQRNQREAKLRSQRFAQRIAALERDKGRP